MYNPNKSKKRWDAKDRKSTKCGKLRGNVSEFCFWGSQCYFALWRLFCRMPQNKRATPKTPFNLFSSRFIGLSFGGESFTLFFLFFHVASFGWSVPDRWFSTQPSDLSVVLFYLPRPRFGFSFTLLLGTIIL